MCFEIKIPRDFPGKMIGGVCDRCPEARMEFTAGSQPTGSARRLEHQHALAVFGQVGSTDQSIVSCTNDN